MFIKNQHGTIVCPLTSVEASRIHGCTILANVSHGEARHIKCVSLNKPHKYAFNTTDETVYYEFINNIK